MSIEERIKSCKLIARGECPHEFLIYRLYLIPELLEPKELEIYEKLCCACQEFTE